jgi:hypothetical protein
MTNTNNTKPSPIEVWLRQNHMAVHCMVVHDDESTHELDIDSMSLRGAQREITGYLLGDGYQPVGRWEMTASQESSADGEYEHWETVRRFRLRG